ncbi:MAG: NAD(P)H-dependent oxidoreductase subunit E [Deltaproteobacteria bacterium]|nr:NAD(P)H-dependent oxidoreductase subunit E [Deltaproteobacteria bacterium]
MEQQSLSPDSRPTEGLEIGERIGFYICHCGNNIAFRVRVKEVAEYVATLPKVVVSRDYLFMCSDPGQELIENDIREYGLTRVVVASCSPRMHEVTFRGACERGGLNPYRAFHMVCVREHVSWVTEDEDEATEKAKLLSRAGVMRVPYQHDLHPAHFPVNTNTLVVGGGIAGMQASLDIASAGFKAYLVEKSPTVGGHMLQYDKTFPTLDCAACIGTPKMVSVGQSSNIELLSYSEVEEVSGFVGNFKVKVRKKARYIDASKCTGCGDCETVCPVQFKPYFKLPPPKLEIEEEREAIVAKIIERYEGQPGKLLPIMIDVNSEFRWLPPEVLRYLSIELDVPLAQIMRLATFYNYFSLEPRGRHLISVCLGTGCFVKGGNTILSTVERKLGVKAGETTKDMRFSLEMVRCLGCCALAPVVRIDDDFHGKVEDDKMPLILTGYE